MLRVTGAILPEAIAGSWCNENPVTSSALEAISFITPPLENFFVRTVADCLVKCEDAGLLRRCREFIHEESTHTRAHKKFNAALLGYLLAVPIGTSVVQRSLTAARQHLSLSLRLFLVVTLEHFSTVLSKRYLTLHSQWQIQSPYAKQMFEQHAQEELSHCSVVFDLWTEGVAVGRFSRIFVVSSLLLIMLLYLAVATPWVLYRKKGRSLFRTGITLLGYICTRRPMMKSLQIFGELFSFASHDFRPEQSVSNCKLSHVD